MDPVVKPMESLVANIGTVLTASTGWFKSVSDALIGNEVFGIMLALVILILLATFLVNLVGKIRARQRAN